MWPIITGHLTAGEQYISTSVVASLTINLQSLLSRKAGWGHEDGRQLSIWRKDSLLWEIVNRRHVQDGDMDDELSVPEGRTEAEASAGRRSRLTEPARRDSDLAAAEAGNRGPNVVGLRRAELTTWRSFDDKLLGVEQPYNDQV